MSPRPQAGHPIDGRVVASHGRDASVVDDSGRRVHCRLQGRRLTVVCGDRVRWIPADTEGGGGNIVGLRPRVNLLERLTLRGDAEPVAANLTQLVAVLAPVPIPDFGLSDRYLAAAEWNGLRACIVANKSDLAEHAATLGAALDEYSRIGYAVLRVSKRSGDGAAALRELLAGETSVLVGQSGVGKSSLTNLMIPGVEASVDEVTRASESGRHTTSTSSLYELPSGGELIDSPGVRDFSPPLPPPRGIAGGFREIAGMPVPCRFRDCLHLREPGCAVSAACDAGSLSPRRLGSYRRLLELAEEMAARQPRVRR